MEDRKIKLVIGFITYGKSTAKYLPYFLPSLVRTTDSRMNTRDYTDYFKILAFDNSEEDVNDNVKFIKKNYPEIEIMRKGENLGFAKAYNKMIKRAKEYGAEYFLVINPDMILEPSAIGKMLEAMDTDNELGSVSPKILRWDFKNKKKTNIIDSCGIVLKQGLRFVNAGEGEKNETDINKKILGPAGTAAMYRISVLDKICMAGQYFDELMFMYKEDCDLAYRLFLAGFKSKCVNDAVVYHDRSAGARGEGNLNIAFNRGNKNKQIKKWSFLNQQIIFIKYWKLQDWRNKLAVVWYELKMIAFAVLFEQYLLLELIKIKKIKTKTKIYK